MADQYKGGTAITDIIAERMRQREAEGFDDKHDDAHNMGEIALAAAAYASNASPRGRSGRAFAEGPGGMCYSGWFNMWSFLWPWDRAWWKPSDPRRDLVKAGALIIAEIERLDRQAERAHG